MLVARVIATLAFGASFASAQQPTTAYDSPVGTIAINQQVRGTLTGATTLFQNSPAHFWWSACRAGDTFQFDAIAVWDTFAIVADPNGKIVARDDDGSGESNARIVHACASSGNYRLGITTQNASGEVGEYRLVVRNPQLGQFAGGPQWALSNLSPVSTLQAPFRLPASGFGPSLSVA